MRNFGVIPRVLPGGVRTWIVTSKTKPKDRSIRCDSSTYEVQEYPGRFITRPTP